MIVPSRKNIQEARKYYETLRDLKEVHRSWVFFASLFHRTTEKVCQRRQDLRKLGINFKASGN